jgi:hypothetical protein
MIGKKLIIFSLFLVLLIDTSVFGATISASVDRQDVGLGDPVTLKISIGGKGGSIQDPTLPPLNDFEIYSSGRSQNISIVNGAFTSSLDVTYILVPKKIGQLTIGPITVHDQDGTASTQPIIIKVSQQGTSSAQGPQNQGQQPSTPHAQPPQKGGDFFIDQRVDKTNPYVGEQVVLTFRFYQAVSLWDQPTLEWPKYEGLTLEDLPPNSRYYEAVGGRRYLVTEIKRALFPITSGKIVIGSPQLTIKADDFGSNFDPFGFFDQNMRDLFRRGQPKILTADPVALNVKPLPEQNKPSNFSGAVGKFSIKIQTDKDSVGVDEPITLKFLLSGTGNIRSLSPIKLPELPDFRVYDSGNTESISNANQIVSGTRTFEQAIIPKTSGVFEVPSILFSYFDPTSADYKTISTPPIKIAASGAGLVDVGGAPKNIIGAGKLSLGYIITDYPESDGKVDLAGSFWFWLLQFVPLVAIGAAIFYRARSNKLLSDRGYARRVGAGKRLRSIFKKAADLKIKGDLIAFYAALYDAVIGFVADRLNLEKAGLTLDELRSKESIPAEIREELTTFLDSCLSARFAPQAAEVSHADKMLDDAGDLINRLEKTI